MSDIEDIVRFITSLDFQEEPKPFIEFLTEYFVTVCGDDASVAEKKAASRSNGYGAKLKVRSEKWGYSGVTPYFRFDDINQEITWSELKIKATDGHAERWRKIRLRRRPEIFRQMQALKDDQFERLIVALSRYGRVPKFHVTERSNDFGIDGLAIFDSYSSFGLFRRNDLNHKVIIQAKKYETKVSRDKIQVMCDTLNLVRTRSSRISSLIPDWFWSADGTISGWVLGLHGFQSGSVDYARDNGILLSDGSELAHVICTSRNFDPTITNSLVDWLPELRI